MSTDHPTCLPEQQFTRERDLQETLAGLLPEPTTTFEVTFVRRELLVGGCRPDVLYVSFAEPPTERVWSSRWTYRHSHVLWLLRSARALPPETIADAMYEALDRLRPTLDELVKGGAVIQRDSGELMLSPALSSLDAEVIAVEAKLKRWREALNQARTYQRFADRVFVAMDPAFVPRDEATISLFAQHRVGLCSVNNDAFEWIVIPFRTETQTPEREYLLASAAYRNQTLWSARYARKASCQA